MRAAAALLASAFLIACQPAGEAPAPEAPPAAVAAAQLAEGIEVTAPAAGARVTSPLRVTGTATGGWYFEAIFDAQLVAADGRVIARAPAQAQSDWMTPAPVPFLAELVFEAPAADENATIVLTEDQTGEKPNLRQARIPVVLSGRD